GTVVAPNATIRLAPLNGGSHEGSFFAKRLEAEARTPINFVPFDHWDFIMPPILTVECVSRAANFNSAALFSFTNQLDYTVNIEGGDRNYVETEKLKKDPLEVFEPGVHTKYYWVPFTGKKICWTLSGNKVCANLSTRGCTLDDYTIVPQNVSYQPSSTLSAPILPNDPTDYKWSFIAKGEASLNKATLDETLYSSDERSKIIVKPYYHHHNHWDDLYLKLDYLDQVQYKDLLKKGSDVASFGWLSDMDDLEMIFYFDPPQVASSTGFWPIKLYIKDKEEHEIGDTVTFWKVDQEISEDGKTVRNDANSLPGTLDQDEFLCGIYASQDGAYDLEWGACYRVEVRDPKICLNWNAEYIGGAGEDDYNLTGIQSIPASFTYAKFNITGAKEGYANWPGYYPLDADGCIPEEYMPSLNQLIAADPAIPVVIEYDIAGRLEYFDDVTSQSSIFNILNKEDYDPYLRIPIPATVPPTQEQVFNIHDSFEVDQNTLGSQFKISHNIEYNNEFTKTAAGVSHLLKKQYDDYDMDLVNKNIDIYAQSQSAITAANTGTAFAYENKVYLRDANGVEFGDSTRKFTFAHEFGHAIQFLESSELTSINANYLYTIVVHDKYGKVSTDTNPQALPDECRCFTSSEFSPKHCMQSLEWPTSAISEAFAHFYAAISWNEQSENDCWFSFVKWMYTPDCPAGNICHDAKLVIADTDTSVLSKLNDFPEQPDTDSDWQMVEAPVNVSCDLGANQIKWQKWRNRYCTSDGIDLDSDGDIEYVVGDADNNMIVDYVTSDDMRSMGVEMDWMRFFWEINTKGDSDERWSVADITKVLETAALDTTIDTDTDTDTDFITGANSVTFEKMLKAARALQISTPANWSAKKINFFINKGAIAGVDENLQ
ncbi:MAG: hypothetical protein JXR91_04575, partial [Deltaproteobacteria bacterium]|nr:hypothetical protein [Deltaproteobacteria bacterium]